MIHFPTPVPLVFSIKYLDVFLHLDSPMLELHNRVAGTAGRGFHQESAPPGDTLPSRLLLLTAAYCCARSTQKLVAPGSVK